MQPRQTEQSAEQQYVDDLYARLDRETERVRADLDDAVRASSTDPAEAYTREVRVAMLGRRARTLGAAEHHLCFGRIDGADGRTLHIGRTGLSDGDDQLLVDWRAEAARPFYAATAAHPMGLRRRRHLALDDRRVSRVSDEILDGTEPGPHDVVGDGPLLEAISARRTGRMRDVVATLQAEQDAIIRSAHRGVTVVQGGPGTGKTVVALHRAAYVLAGFDEARTDGVLVLGPGTRFLDYIAEVLPSLGENDVAMSTADRLVADALGLAEPAAAGHELRRAAGDARLADELAEIVRDHQAPSGTLTVLVDGDPVTLDEHALAEARETAGGTGLPHNQARALFKDLVVEWVADEVQARARVFLAKLDEDIEVLTGGVNVDKAAAGDLARLGFAPDEGGAFGHAAAVAELDPGALQAELAEDVALERAVEGAWPHLVAQDVVLDLLDAHPELTDPGRAPSDGETPAWTAAHLPLLDEAEHLLDGPPARIYGHVVVDEAQELTPMQWRSVLRRCPGRSMTVVGDLAQAGPATGAASWADALGTDLARRADVRTLTVCYRTTAEVLEVAAPLLARIAPDQAPTRAVRHGDVPRRVPAAPGELVAAVVREAGALAAVGPDDLVAVVAADARVREVADALDGTRVRVVPVSQVRGLEFDAVVVADPDGITAARPGGERDLYVALTRPTRRLTVVG
ncbi:HelD family protein [Promicromonospora sp. NPDC090134]|uniref:HelD family protein n=1 Tax=Promicromonospora sp. NPDC090134 TaxID=3364408 RepID=UPI003803DDFB